MDEPTVVLDRVSYMYPRSPEPVLRDISLQIHQGEFLGLIGPTGAGKTTLCLALNGIVPQFYGGRFFGRATVAGLDTLDHPISQLARHVGAVFQDPETQLIATSVENEIAFALENLSVPRAEIRARIPRVLAAVRLAGTERKHPHELSGGQKQRLAIAAALAMQPALLVLDEPTSQLDPVGEQEVFAVVRELNRELGITILMASHAAEQVAEYADRIALLSRGELVTIGTPDEIYSHVDLLHQHHLRPPQVASTFTMAREAGVPVTRVPVRLEPGLKALDSLREACPIAPPEKLPEPPARSGPPLLSVQDLRHVYPDGTEALQGVSLDVRAGEYVLVIGQNGAGKTTLVKHFLKLLEPTEGIVTVGGVDTQQLTVSELARRIGYVAQNPDNQIFSNTVGDEVAFALANLDYPREEVEARTVESLDAMGLLEVRDAHPLSLPKGDRARIVIAAILAMKPEVIIFDEPTTGQDYRGAKTILDVSRRLHQMGKTVVVITHHLYLMPEYAERVIVMGKGTILLDAPIREAYHQTDLLRSTFLSPPQAVLLAQHLGRQGGGDYRLLTPAEVAACLAPPFLPPSGRDTPPFIPPCGGERGGESGGDTPLSLPPAGGERGGEGGSDTPAFLPPPAGGDRGGGERGCPVSLMKFQTVERDSLFTRLDFRPKLLIVAVVSVVAFVWESPVALAVLALALVVACLLVGVKVGYIRTIVTVMLPFYVLLLVTHGFWNVEQVKALTGREELTPLFTFPAGWWLIGGGRMSVEGFTYGWAVIFKTLALVTVIPLGIFTTEVDNMIVGLVRARVPYKLVFVFSSTLRFFPLLFQEIQTIIEAQRLRGLAVEKMGPAKRVRVYGRVAVPLILGAMVKSQQLEVVLQSKAFTGSGERTYLHESVLRGADWAVIALFALLFVVAAVLYFWLGVGKFAWLIFR